MSTRHLLSFVTLTLFAVPAIATPPEVQQRTLANGLKVIVKEDHRAPVVTSQVWYAVGSANEYSGLTGISHVLEHMMFQGTPEHPGGEFSRIIAEQGGNENAFTSRDYTAYYQNLERSRLPIAFELEADRMQHLALLDEAFNKELKVVMEERRLRTEDQPNTQMAEQFNAVAWQASPYHNPVIGWMDDIQNLSVAELREWYRAWYAPNNATLVVVGDVTPAEVFTLAERYFGPLPRRETPKLKPRTEPEQKGERRVTVQAPAELPSLLLGYKVPTLATASEPWEAYALEVLAGVLDGDDSARLTRELVRGKALAAGIGAGYDLYSPREGLLQVSGTPSSGHTVAELEQAILQQLDQLKREPVAVEELERIKAQVMADEVYKKDSLFAQATEIGQLETIGLGWQVGEGHLAQIRAVTPEQIQQVAQRYLVDRTLTVATLDPLPIDHSQMALQESNSDAIR